MTHGTLKRYKHGCKCEPCRRANADYVAERRRLTKGRPVKRRTPRTHGTNACYQAGCRRPECREAHRIYAAKWRHRDTPIPTWVDRDDWVAVERWLEQQRVAKIVEPRVNDRRRESPWQRTQAEGDNVRPQVGFRDINPIVTLTLDEYRRQRASTPDVVFVQPHRRRVAA